MDDLAEDVARELVVVAALEDELVGLVDLGEHPAARAEDQDVGHDVGEGEDLVGEPERGCEVVAPEHLLAQRPVVLARAGEESGRDDVDPEAARAEQVEAAAEEVVVRALVAVAPVRVLGPRLVARAVRRVRDEKAGPPSPYPRGMSLLCASVRTSLLIQVREVREKGRGPSVWWERAYLLLWISRDERHRSTIAGAERGSGVLGLMQGAMSGG